MTRTGVNKSNFQFFSGSFFLLALMVGTMAMPAQANAGLLDWLFPRRAERVARRWSRATTAYRPVSGYGTGYTGANTSYYGGNFAGGQNFGSGSYYPSYGSWNGWGYQTNAGYYSTYRPTTVYRTQWSPVPVTTYSPTAGGAYQQPCTSHEWQALRVPYTSYQPAYQTAATGAGSSCGCASRPTTVQHGGGWQPVAPAAAATTTGYAPTVDYANATPWTSAESGSAAGSVAATSAESGWQTVPRSEPRRTFEKQVAPLDDGVAGGTPWRRVGEDESTPANRAPRLEDRRLRDTYYREDPRVEYERERDAYARKREELLRKERELDDLIQRQRERASDDGGRRSDLDRFSDWERRDSDTRGGSAPLTRYDDWQSVERTPRSTYAPRSTYRPPGSVRGPSQASQLDRERSEFYQRSTEERNAYRPMLDDGWSYDNADRRNRSDRDNDRYDWRSTSNDRPTYSTRTQSVPASMPNHRPRTNGSTAKGVMPLLLQPIPESNDNWNTQRAPKLLGPRDRTAALPTNDRWQAIPADSPSPAKLKWRSVRGS